MEDESPTEFTIKDLNKARIERYKERISRFERSKETCKFVISGLESLCREFDENQEKIQTIVQEVHHLNVYDSTTNMVTPYGKDAISLDDYIDFLQNKVDLIDKHLKKLQEELEELLPKPSMEEMSDKYRKQINKLNRSMIPQLMRILLERVAALRGNLTEQAQVPESADSSSEATASSPSPSPSKKLLQKICLVLEITDCYAIDRIYDVFGEKSEKEILSDYGLVIILALSNIEGYTSSASSDRFEYIRSMKGMFMDDDWMFRMLFESDRFDLVSFPCLFFRAFEHPFIQCSLTFKYSSDKEELKKTLHYMNKFTRSFHDINDEACLTFDDRWSSSHHNLLPISPYLVHASSLSRILELEYPD